MRTFFKYSYNILTSNKSSDYKPWNAWTSKPMKPMHTSARKDHHQPFHPSKNPPPFIPDASYSPFQVRLVIFYSVVITQYKKK